MTRAPVALVGAETRGPPPIGGGGWVCIADMGTLMIDPNDCRMVRFSTDAVPEKDRIAIWREYYGRLVLNVDIEPAPETAFEAALTTRSLPGLRVTAGSMSAARITRTHEAIADGNDDLVLTVNQSGAVTVSARGRELTLGKGEAVLMDGGEVTAFHRHSAGCSLSLCIPRQVLSALVADLDDVVMRQIPAETDALRFLTGYLGSVLGEADLEAPAMRQLAVNHVSDLVSVALGATVAAAEIAHGRGIPAARLKAAKTFIIENFRRPISVGSLARHLGVTPRYLQRLFETSGTTFSAFLLNHRLRRVYRILCDARYDGCTVEMIAYDSGFGDISHFHRCFRRLYGLTPKEARKQSLNQRVMGNVWPPMRPGAGLPAASNVPDAVP